MFSSFLRGLLGQVHSVLDRCYCPYQNCSALVINECGGTVKKSTCPNCKKLFCYTCQVPWHAGFWCTETQQRRDANDLNFGVLIENFQWSRCSQCGQAVELVSGCQNVKCRCGKQFCHKCGGSIHFGTCDHPGRCCCNCCWFFLL